MTLILPNRTTVSALAMLGTLACAAEEGASPSEPSQPTAGETLPASTTAPSTSPSPVVSSSTPSNPGNGSSTAVPGTSVTVGTSETAEPGPSPPGSTGNPESGDEPTTDGPDTGGPNTGGQTTSDEAVNSGPTSGSPVDSASDDTSGPVEEDCTSTDAAENFSFFVTSMFHILELSGSEDGFGGDLRYNGAATGLEGADAICQEMARRVCHGHKVWRAFLSTSQVDAIDRIGTGPWYDHSGALVAQDVSGLAGQERPAGGCCDTGTFDELGLFHDGQSNGDDHDTLTGSNAEGRLDTASSTCDDWTSTTASGRPRIGHSWPRSANSGREWIMDHNAGGCGAGINIMSSMGGGDPSVGSGGGYGGFYCFAQ